MNAVSCIKIQKIYKKKSSFILNIDDFKLEDGKIYALLGPNGAGKSTFIKIILNILFPDTGTITIYGKKNNYPSARKFIGYLPEEYSIPTDITFYQFLKYFGKMYDIDNTLLLEQINEYCDALNLKRLYDKKNRELSKGMKQSLLFIHSLLGKKKILILDEPFNGLDVEQKAKTIEFLLSYKSKNNITILITTHILSDIVKFVESIFIISNGQIKAQNSINNILKNCSSLESFYLENI